MVAENKRLSISECKEILNQDKGTYTDEEIIFIRDCLYNLAEIEFNFYKNNKSLDSNKANDLEIL